jgi:hypothetical protein
VAFDGDVMRHLAAQFLALADKRMTAPLMVGHRLIGISLLSSTSLMNLTIAMGVMDNGNQRLSP